LQKKRRTGKSWWRNHGAGIGSWVHILRTWCSRQLTTSGLSVLEQLETLRNDMVSRVKFAGTSISIDGV
jgi:hypothetical protein